MLESSPVWKHQTLSIPMPRDSAVLSSPDCHPHSGWDAHRWEPSPSWVGITGSTSDKAAVPSAECEGRCVVGRTGLATASIDLWKKWGWRHLLLICNHILWHIYTYTKILILMKSDFFSGFCIENLICERIQSQEAYHCSFAICFHLKSQSPRFVLFLQHFG